MVDPFTVVTLGAKLWNMIKGRKEVSQDVEGVKNIIQEGTKGLIRSKTANAAHAGLILKLVAVLVVPVPPEWAWLTYIGLIGVVAEWAVNLYLRVKTKGPV